MLVFLDFEASSLSKRSYPIEVGWVFEDGCSESYLIRPAPDWTDWEPEAEAIHRIPRTRLEAEGVPAGQVAFRMVESLTGHDLLASAPSWDGKWLSVLLRAAGLPRHALRLRDSDEAHLEIAVEILHAVLAPERLDAVAAGLVAGCEPRPAGEPPPHRALADAQEERLRWLKIRDAAVALAGSIGADGGTRTRTP